MSFIIVIASSSANCGSGAAGVCGCGGGGGEDVEAEAATDCRAFSANMRHVVGTGLENTFATETRM